MKKLLLFTFALFLWTGAWADKVIYLEPNIWDDKNVTEYYAVHAWGGTSDAAWYDLVQVDGTTYYKAAIPDDCTNVLFTRASSQETAKDGWWNKTEDITLPSSVNAVAYIITSYTSGYGGNSAGIYTGYYPNHARLGTATCSESEGGRSADKAIDGNMSTLWGSNVDPVGEGRTKDNAWWQVDLGENFAGNYNYVIISWDNEPAKKFKIQTSSDGVDWTDVYVDDDDTNEPENKTCKYALSSTQTARYVKFQGVERATGYGYGFYEFQVSYIDAFVLGSMKLEKYIFPEKTGIPPFHVYLYDTEETTFEGSITFSWKNNVGPTGYVFHADSKTVEFGAAAEAGTYTLQATANDVTVSRDIVLVKDGPDAPQPSASKVLALYSDTYGATEVGGWAPAFGWGYNYKEEYNLSGNKCLHVHGLGSWGFPYTGNGDDLKDYKYLKFDVFAMDDVDGYVNIDKSNIANKNFSVTGGSWQTITIDITGVEASEVGGGSWVDIRFGENSTDKDRDVLIDNAYFLKEVPPFDPTSVTSITVTAASTEIAEGKTTQLTVKDQADNTIEAENITFESSNTSVATVSAEGVVTAVAAGPATITATVTGYSVNSTVDITVTEAPLGFDLTEGNHTIHVTPYHYVGTNNYKLVITSEETMTGMGGSFWNINGVGKDMRINDEDQTYTVTDHKITITTTSTTAPNIYTPLYVIMSGEVNFGSVDLEWIEAQEVNITSYKWASFSSSNALDFGKVEGLKAYYATANDGLNISYNTVEKAPAGTGVILGGEQGNYDVPVIDAAPALSSTNLLQSTAAGAYTILAEDVNKVYVFGKIGSDIGFVKGEVDYVIGANKSYLRLTNELAAKGFNFIGLPGSETDGINKVNTLVETGVRYNLAGQRVGNDYKGIVIVNGRKVVIK